MANQGFYEFRRQLEYKCQWYSSELVVVDRFFPSSKTCSNCGHVQDMPWHLRTYDCPEFGLSIHRDLNASINLRDAVGLTVNACGRSAADSSGRNRK
ncbi:zinc ribbon domain-containing protein [Dapis sp. BLCC M172]|uniref:zinc ribbon domain-containing protein n=1 Tax=Dapis sp. BLCC M172 TaxID=2975281 RepID=UPI003CEC436F